LWRKNKGGNHWLRQKEKRKKGKEKEKRGQMPSKKEMPRIECTSEENEKEFQESLAMVVCAPYANNQKLLKQKGAFLCVGSDASNN
jgi:hypothetical protein